MYDRMQGRKEFVPTALGHIQHITSTRILPYDVAFESQITAMIVNLFEFDRTRFDDFIAYVR